MSYAIDGRYIQDHFPGIGRYTYNLIEALGRMAQGVRFRVLYNPAQCNTRYNLAALFDVPNLEWQPVDIPTVSWREQLGLPISPANLFHSPYYVKPYVQHTPSVITLFDLLPIRFPAAIPSLRARFFFRIAMQVAVRTSAHIIVPSGATQRDVAVLLHVPLNKMTVVPLAADERFVPQSEDATARVQARYGLPDKYVLYVGINKPHKNLATLVHAWRKLDDTRPELVIAGAWDERYPVGRDEGIRFVHNIADAALPALYTGACVLVSPSFYEGFGLTPLEAMACGTPVISSNASSLPEVVGDAALFFDPGSVDELSNAMRRVLDDLAFRRDLAHRSLARAAQFSWEQTARATLAVYQSVARAP